MLSEELKERLAKLSGAEQRHLIGFLHCRLQPPEFWQEMTAILDDKDPSHWIPLEKVREMLRDLP